MEIIAYLIVFFGFINLIRITLLLVGSDLYGLSHHRKYKNFLLSKYPKISVVIPAYNEEHTIQRAIKSVVMTNYPSDKLEIIVVDDGSEDRTSEKVSDFITKNNFPNIRLISQQNSGKARALNRGMKEYATGSLVMCLDADSTLDKNAFKNAIKYFEDKKVIALASNVKIMKGKGILNAIQKMEYLVCYQMKRAQTFYNIEYIIGGIGSMFRKSYLKRINFYDANTVTEDIDITMKILQAGNRKIKVMYGSDVISYTPSVLTLGELITQRYRWKWGRYQTFLKNSNMFFTGSKKHTKGLTWIYLPFALFSEAGFLLEPLFVTYILGVSIYFNNIFPILSAYTVMTFYLVVNILAEDTDSFRQKVHNLFKAPGMYFLFYILSFVEYFVLIKTLIRAPKLGESLNIDKNTWQHVRRPSGNLTKEILLDKTS